MHFPKNKRRGRTSLQRPAVDKGTPELQQKRCQLAGEKDVTDPSLTESLLGILYAHRLIPRPLYEAGRFFGDLGWRYQPCLGHTLRHWTSKITIKCQQRQREQNSLLTEEEELRRTKAWRKALSVLQKAGFPAYQTVLRVVFYDQDLYASPLLETLKTDVEALRKGLGELDTYFTAGKRDNSNTLVCQAQDPQKATTLRPAGGGLPRKIPLLHPS